MIQDTSTIPTSGKSPVVMDSTILDSHAMLGALGSIITAMMFDRSDRVINLVDALSNSPESTEVLTYNMVLDLHQLADFTEHLARVTRHASKMLNRAVWSGLPKGTDASKLQQTEEHLGVEFTKLKGLEILVNLPEGDCADCKGVPE